MTTTSPNDSVIVPSPLAAISLKLVGAIAILVALIDFLTLLFPPDFSNRAWQLSTVTGLVDRGLVPLVGVALLFTGYWIDTSLGRSARKSTLFLDARFWTCLLSCLLGLIFLVTTVLHPNNVRVQSRDALAQVAAEAEQATADLETQLNSDLAQRRAQIDALLENESQLQAAIASGSLDEAQVAQIERFRSNPQELDSFLNSQVSEAQTELQTQISDQREDATKRLKSEATKATLRVTLSSLLLAVGYTLIGWLGLKRLLAMVR
ncbi:hypothetical protein S7335_4792 [Synechococcus sp. PCC 7335]|uniref:hormogonium polysaccharide biosynthesis protein HpsJ n=1 Tax=Synechococcus sp. (strain ATCC 29403 / PCC 7335) TaxID=91464 RepID=UPI00017EB513|nr:HpsJ family protein [Synechococcus sp. PCC 7335]EDX87085.1 hypothetical protein S7335_4792 [Synechococcus sp. PCC 7335]